jgi:RNA polymerase sigma-70 factor (ECF subfamily)
MQPDDLQNQFLAAFDAYQNAIFRFCLLKVSNRDVAQDITQETFMRYWQTLRASEDEPEKKLSNERAYLYAIARNLVIDWYRRKKDASLDSIMETGMDFEGSISARTITDYASTEEILKVLNTLEEGDRELILLRYIEGYGPQEIAKLLNESPNVVSVRIHRAIKKLQVSLGIQDTTA